MDAPPPSPLLLEPGTRGWGLSWGTGHLPSPLCSPSGMGEFAQCCALREIKLPLISRLMSNINENSLEQEEVGFYIDSVCEKYDDLCLYVIFYF